MGSGDFTSVLVGLHMRPKRGSHIQTTRGCESRTEICDVFRSEIFGRFFYGFLLQSCRQSDAIAVGAV